MNSIYYNDIKELTTLFRFQDDIRGKSILITGGTGLIGSFLVQSICDINKEYNLDIKLTGVARSEQKVKALGLDSKCEWIYGDIKNIDYSNGIVDYIIHTASPTQSSYLFNNPVETIEDTVLGAINLIKTALKHSAKIIYLSSIEVYGEIEKDSSSIKENMYGFLNHINPRAGYPESKKLVECLLSSYSKEYGLKYNIVRLTQTMGTGIQKEDNRIFAYIAKSIVCNTDIVLNTLGQSSKPYIYTIDAANAIYYIMFNGQENEVYNVANEDTYISVADMAKMVIEHFNNNIKLVFNVADNSKYAPTTKVRLDTAKLQKIGWHPRYSLLQMYERLISYYRENQS